MVMRPAGRMAVVVLMGLLPLRVLATETITARASVSRSDVLVGDWINVRVDIDHPRGATFQMIVGDTLGGYTVLDRAPLTQVADTITTTAVVVARYDSGTSVLPPLTFLATVPGDTVLRSVETNPVMLTVHTVQVDTAKDIKDLKPPLGMPYTLAEILIVAGIVLLVAAVAVLVYRRWKRRRSAPGPAEPQAPSRPPHVLALEELAILKEKQLWQQGRLKEYYTELTDILRRYLEHRYTIMALEETSQEILSALRDLKLAPRVVERMEGILVRADLVKFAKHHPAISEHDETMVAAREFVERTRPVTLSPAAPAPGEKEDAAHVGA